MDFFNSPLEKRKVAIVSAKDSFSVMGIRKKLQEAGMEGVVVAPSVFQLESAVDESTNTACRTRASCPRPRLRLFSLVAVQIGGFDDAAVALEYLLHRHGDFLVVDRPVVVRLRVVDYVARELRGGGHEREMADAAVSGHLIDIGVQHLFFLLFQLSSKQ